MKPEFITKDEFKVIGMEITTTVEENKKEKTISKLWDRFVPRLKEIKNKKERFNTFGICFEEENSPNFSYIACAEVENFDCIPEGMTARTIPAYRYAVFTHRDSLDKIYETYNYIYNTWLKDSGYKKAGPDFELYDESFCGPDSEVYIYIPIEKL